MYLPATPHMTLLFSHATAQSKLHYIFKQFMSGKFSSTGTTLAGTSSLFKQQEWIRQIVQSEMMLIFDDIKVEIEAKIKSIDRNIIDLRNELRKMGEQHKVAVNADLLDRMQKIEAQMQILKYHQQNTLKVSRTKSLDKERKPIFKREDNQYDFSSIVLGLDSEAELHSQKVNTDKKEIGRPPLPKQTNKSQKTLQENRSEPYIRNQQRQVFKRNPVLEDTGSIHRWLTQNNNRQSSCFSAIIREQEIEESIFY